MKIIQSVITVVQKQDMCLIITKYFIKQDYIYFKILNIHNYM